MLRGASPGSPSPQPRRHRRRGSGRQLPGRLPPRISPRRGASAPAGSPGEEDEGDRRGFPMIPREAVISKRTRPLGFAALGVGRVLLCGGRRGMGGEEGASAAPTEARGSLCLCASERVNSARITANERPPCSSQTQTRRRQEKAVSFAAVPCTSRRGNTLSVTQSERGLLKYLPVVGVNNEQSCRRRRGSGPIPPRLPEKRMQTAGLWGDCLRVALKPEAGGTAKPGAACPGGSGVTGGGGRGRRGG